MKRPPWKIIAKASILLLLVIGGAIVNVAVAWTAFALHPIDSARQTERHCSKLPSMGRGGAYFVSSAYHWGIQYHELGLPVGFSSEIITQYKTLPSWCLLQQAGDATVKGDYASGWPCRCIHLIRRGHPQYWGAETIHGAITVPRTLGQRLYPRTSDLTLPAMPIWSGSTINTLFYAATLWLLIRGPFVLRRMWRIKRGLCPTCAYPVGASDLCTECGMPIPAPLIKRARSQANHFPESPSSL